MIIFANKKGDLEMEQAATTVFNPTQIQLLRMFAIDSSQESLDELKEVLYQYYSKKMKQRLNELWDLGVLDQKRLDEINSMDLHKLGK